MRVQSIPSYGAVFKGVTNTSTVQATGKSSRVRLFKALVLFSQEFASVGKTTYHLSVGLSVHKRLVLCGVLRIKRIYTHRGIQGRNMLDKCKVLITWY